MATGRKLSTRSNKAICRCGNVHLPEEVPLLYTSALHPATSTSVARYRESHPRDTYLDVVDFAQHEGGAVLARTKSSQLGRVKTLLQRLRPSALLQFPWDNKTSATSSMPAARVPGKAVETVNTFQPTSKAPEYDHEPSTAPRTSEQPNAAPISSPSMIPAPQLRYADHKAQFARPTCFSKKNPVRAERPLAATAQTKQHLTCHEYDILGHIAPDCVLLLQEQK